MNGSILDQLSAAFGSMVETLVAWTPRVALGLLLLVLALVAAKIVEWVLRSVLTRLKFDQVLTRAGIDRFLKRIGVRRELSQFLPRLVYYLLLILFAKTAADALGLAAISDAIGAFTNYLPNIVAALLILILGSAAAQFAGRAVSDAADSSGIDFASTLGQLVSGVLFFVLGIMALSQLKIDTEMIQLVSMGAIAGLAIAFGLSFGLGSRDITRNIIAGFYARKTFAIGEEIEMRGERGILESVTPTQTLIRQADRLVAVPNAVFLDDVVKQ